MTTIHDLATAIVAGDVDRIDELLASEPALARAELPDNGRSMLHVATDWPGNRPNVDTTIRLLIDAGADPNVVFPHPENPQVAETPVHWAASSGDVTALAALLDAGADVDPVGGVFDGCTAYEEAIIFEKYDAARLLHERGATDYLPGAAALGRAGDIDGFFDHDGTLRLDVGRLPNWERPPPAQMLLDRAFQFACRAGHLEIARTLLERGARASSRTPVDTTAHDEAAGNGHQHVVAWLDGLGSG